jgi:RpiB/LacA/LacB family sugar-phosphate isomerase
MRIAIGADHWGFEAKEFLKGKMTDEGIEVIDFGAPDDGRSDHPIFADRVARSVQRGESDRGVLICGSGIGMVIAANKVKGIRAAPARTVEDAKLSRLHNDANVLALGGKVLTPAEMWEMLSVWLKTEFLGGKYKERVDMVRRIEEDLPADPNEDRN